MSIMNGDEKECEFIRFMIAERTAMILEQYHKEKSTEDEKEDRLRENDLQEEKLQEENLQEEKMREEELQEDIEELLDWLSEKYLSEGETACQLQKLINQIHESIEKMCSEQGQREEYMYEKGFEDGVKLLRAIWGQFGGCR